MTDSEIKEKLLKLAYGGSKGLERIKSREEYTEALQLTVEYPDIAKDVIFDNYNYYAYGTTRDRLEMIELLLDNNLGEDVALFEAQRLASRHYINLRPCISREGRMLKNWLACKTDEMPTGWPAVEIFGFGYQYAERIEPYIIAKMSKYNEYMARSVVYDMKLSYPEHFRYPVRAMLDLWGLEYTRKFLEDVVERYHVDEAYVMEMYSVGYALPWRTKLETQLYESYINDWVENDWEKYLDVMTKTKDCWDLGKKAYKKIIKPRLEAQKASFGVSGEIVEQDDGARLI